MNGANNLLGVILAVALISCQGQTQGAQHGSDENDVATTSTGEIFYLDPDELARQKALANQGDVQAAMQVAEHYSLGENDNTKSYPWLTIAAEKGNIVAMQNLATSLSAEGGQKNCQNAVAWLKRAKAENAPVEVRKYRINEYLASLEANFDECVNRDQRGRIKGNGGN